MAPKMYTSVPLRYTAEEYGASNIGKIFGKVSVRNCVDVRSPLVPTNKTKTNYKSWKQTINTTYFLRINLYRKNSHLASANNSEIHFNFYWFIINPRNELDLQKHIQLVTLFPEQRLILFDILMRIIMYFVAFHYTLFKMIAPAFSGWL